MTCSFVRECMEPAKVVSLEDSFFSAIALIAEYDYVLVQSPIKEICGIITASDFNDQFSKLAEPFLLVGEIENGIRAMLKGKFSVAELEDAKLPEDKRTISSGSRRSPDTSLLILTTDPLSPQQGQSQP